MGSLSPTHGRFPFPFPVPLPLSLSHGMSCRCFTTTQKLTRLEVLANSQEKKIAQKSKWWENDKNCPMLSFCTLWLPKRMHRSVIKGLQSPLASWPLNPNAKTICPDVVVFGELSTISWSQLRHCKPVTLSRRKSKGLTLLGHASGQPTGENLNLYPRPSPASVCFSHQSKIGAPFPPFLAMLSW